MDWNVIVTVRPGPAHEHQLLGALAAFGRFRATQFRDVCVGRVGDMNAFLEAVRTALEAGRPWSANVARVLPAERVFSFSPETLAEQLKEEVAPRIAQMPDGSSFCVRLERRGLAGRVASQEIERSVADHVYELAAAQEKRMRTDFTDPDFVIAAQTLGPECGLALLPRALRQRYPFVQTR